MEHLLGHVDAYYFVFQILCINIGLMSYYLNSTCRDAFRYFSLFLKMSRDSRSKSVVSRTWRDNIYLFSSESTIVSGNSPECLPLISDGNTQKDIIVDHCQQQVP